jgi:ABC-2 type transport system permease protein
VFHDLLVDLAGTGPRRHQDFIAQARDFLGQWQGVLLPMVMRKDLLQPSDYDRLPRFRFVEEPVATKVWRSSVPTAVLWAFAGTSLGVALWRARQ